MIPSAFLRVFRPLETFSEGERGYWERYILAGGPPRPGRPVYRNESTVRAAHVGLLSSAQGEHADIRLTGGRYYICPWLTRLRILAGIISLRESVPADVADVFVAETEARRAVRELARLRRHEAWAAPTILQSAWHVPVRWFALVDDAERRLVQRPDGSYRLFYWTPIQSARARADRALHRLRRTELEPVAQPVRDLSEWLGRFHPESVVELDYASVSNLFTWDELDDDHGGRDIQEAIEALGRPGGLARAGELYQHVVNRWAEARSRESLN